MTAFRKGNKRMQVKLLSQKQLNSDSVFSCDIFSFKLVVAVNTMVANVCWMKSWRISRGVVSPDRGTKTVD